MSNIINNPAMNVDDYINEMIEKEKTEQINPFLSTRIMAKLQSEQTSSARKTPIWQPLAVVASIVFVIIIGIGIGSYGTTYNYANASLNINDSQMENLNLYTAGDYEWNK